jgi:hypothetical protein
MQNELRGHFIQFSSEVLRLVFRSYANKTKNRNYENLYNITILSVAFCECQTQSLKVQEGDTLRMSAGKVLGRILGYERWDKKDARVKLRKE